ncbi:HNH endonuclease, partial [Photobacterium galatheae]|uniref:HNH endonuclease signature motif containing protein n=1 Tax=Photobacterium galatheae TaxID=1654360 RepID=UPI00202CCFDA
NRDFFMVISCFYAAENSSLDCLSIGEVDKIITDNSREDCDTPAPFETKKGPYLEPHHVHRLADGGPDHPKFVIALCLTCHRRAHYTVDAATFNQTLVEKLVGIEG